MESKTETQPAETKATPPQPAETKPTEDTAMKTVPETKSEPETATEKRKKPEEDGNNSGEDMSEGVKKLTKLVEEHSDVKLLLQELSEKNKTNEKIAEIYRKQVRLSLITGSVPITHLVSPPGFRLPSSLPRVSVWPWVCPRALPSLSVVLASRSSLLFRTR